MPLNKKILIFPKLIFFTWIFLIPALARPAPDIKANSSDGAITIGTNDTLSIRLSLDAGSSAGQNADWWALAATPFGWYHYAAGLNAWTPAFGVSYQGPLFNFSSFEALNRAGLPTGTYTFYFGYDLDMNGALDSAQLSYDSVTVAVAETPASPWPMFHYNAQHTGQSPYNGPQTNNLKWRYTRSDITAGTGPGSLALDRDGIIYVTAANKLLALNSNGELQWSAELAGTGATAISPDGNTVYAVGGAKLYAFTTAGQALWVYAGPSENIHGEPCLAADGTIYFGSWDTYVYALNPDGTLKWKYQTDGAIAPLAAPALSPDESVVYVGSGDPNKDTGGSLYAINTNGILQWKNGNVDQMRVSGAVVGPNGRIYVTGSGKVQCFAPDGTKVWESAKDTAGSLTPSLSADGTIYVGTSSDGKVYAINATNGQTKWSYQTGASSDPADPPYGVLAVIVIGANGTIYVGAMDGAMHALSSAGTLLWKYQTGDNINENCPAIGPDGTLYFSSADKYLYAIKD